MRTLALAVLLLTLAGCGIKRKPQPAINIFIAPPAHPPYIDLHDKFVKNYT